MRSERVKNHNNMPDTSAAEAGAEELRRRNVPQTERGDEDQSSSKAPDPDHAKHKDNPSACRLDTGSYWLTRVVLLRYVSFVYFVAFLVALNQNRALIGKDGLLPADKYLSDISQKTKNDLWSKFKYAPTLLWLFDYKANIDALLDGLAYAGLGLSGLVVVLGGTNMPMMLILWVLYHSIVSVGQTWYSFGWESQLLETGFLAIFLCPLLSMKKLPSKTPTSFIALLGYRWLIFRIMLGAGMIKIRGDKCWMDLTCMNYHYETQPVPNPVSFYMHQEPVWFHKFEVLSNHFVELIAPFLIFTFRRARILGGIIQILFQAILIISGNLSFLNWLTIAPCLACFDDASLSWMFSGKPGSTRWQVWKLQQDLKLGLMKRKFSNWLRLLLNLCFGGMIAYLSVPIVQNLVSSKQIMNTSFDPLRIVNTYGAFGSITKERTEVVFQGTDHDNPNSPHAKWEEYEFNCKPGSTGRRPCLISPYHYRLDWLMWFAAFQNYQYNNWLVHLAAKFLVNDEGATSLIAHNPFKDKQPPKYVRAEHFRYVFTKYGDKLSNNGEWWKRKRIGNYLPPLSLDSLQDYIKAMGWKTPK